MKIASRGGVFSEGVESDRGASAVEFALIAPVLFLLIFLLADIGRLSYVQISLNSAAREAVRASSFGLTTPEINSIANSAAGGAAEVASLKNTSTVSLNLVRSCSASNALGRTTEVQISTNFRWVTPMDLFTSVAPGSSRDFNSAVTLAASGVMVCAG
jgi:Flp pilus assembly protein TadG